MLCVNTEPVETMAHVKRPLAIEKAKTPVSPVNNRNTLMQRISSTGTKIEDLNATELFKMADKDADGSLTAEEFVKIQEAIKSRVYAQLAKEVELESHNTRMRRRMWWLIALMVIMAVMLGLSVTATALVVYRTVDKQIPIKSLMPQETGDMEIETNINLDGTFVPPIATTNLVSKGDPTQIVGTVTAETNYPLLVAPYLPMHILSSVKTMAIRRNTVPLNQTTGEEIDISDEDENTRIESLYTIVGVDKVFDVDSDSEDDTVVIFYTARNDRIYVYYDSATIAVESMGETYAVCVSDVTCSSISVDDTVDVADYLETTMPSELYEKLLDYIGEESNIEDANYTSATSSNRQLRSYRSRSTSRTLKYDSKYRGTRSSYKQRCQARYNSYQKTSESSRSRRMAEQYRSSNYQKRYQTQNRNRYTSYAGSRGGSTTRSYSPYARRSTSSFSGYSRNRYSRTRSSRSRAYG